MCCGLKMEVNICLVLLICTFLFFCVPKENQKIIFIKALDSKWEISMVTSICRRCRREEKKLCSKRLCFLYLLSKRQLLFYSYIYSKFKFWYFCKKLFIESHKNSRHHSANFFHHLTSRKVVHLPADTCIHEDLENILLTSSSNLDHSEKLEH